MAENKLYKFLVCSLFVLLCRSLCFYVRLSHYNKDYLLTYLFIALYIFHFAVLRGRIFLNWMTIWVSVGECLPDR